MNKRAFSNKLGNHLCQIKLGGSSRSWVISELCSTLQGKPSSFASVRDPGCLIAIHTFEFHLNFLGFEVFGDQKANDCSLLHLVFFERLFVKRKHSVVAHRTN
jgi:hypothetical protein